MEKTISIINYGMGNIGSVENAVSTLNFKPTVVDNPENLNSSDKIIGRNIFKSLRSFDAKNLDLSLKILNKKKSILIDIGANIGTIGIYGITKKYFEKMNELKSKTNLNELSMGMSNDYVEAAKCSSTYVRVGSKIFGARI